MSAGLLLVGVLSIGHAAAAAAEGNDWQGYSVACHRTDEHGDGSLYCHGIRLVRRIVQGLLEEAKGKRSIEVADGVSLVRLDETMMEATRDGRVLNGFGQVGPIVSFLGDRELRIRLQNLIPGNWEAAVEKTLLAFDKGNRMACDDVARGRANE